MRSFTEFFIQSLGMLMNIGILSLLAYIYKTLSLHLPNIICNSLQIHRNRPERERNCCSTAFVLPLMLVLLRFTKGNNEKPYKSQFISLIIQFQIEFVVSLKVTLIYPFTSNDPFSLSLFLY